MAYGLTATGLVTPTEAELIAEARDDLLAARLALGLSTDIDFDTDGVYGPLTAVIGGSAYTPAQLLQAIRDGIALGSAAGQQLDDLCAVVGVTRKTATFSTVTLTLGGTSGTVVLPGARARGGGANDDAEWVIEDAVTIPGDVAARAAVTGAVAAGVGEIDGIVTPVAGWDTVTNAAAADEGIDRESDAALRIRRESASRALGKGSVIAIRSALEALDFVTAAEVLENTSMATAVVDGVAIPGGHVAAFVWPSSLSAAQETTIAETIATGLPGGTGSDGAEVVTVTTAQGYERSIEFSYATSISTTIAATVVLAPGFALADVQTPAQAAIEAYMDTLSVGDDVRLLQLQSRLAGVDGIVSLSALTINAVAADLTIDSTQIAVLSGTPSVTT